MSKTKRLVQILARMVIGALIILTASSVLWGALFISMTYPTVVAVMLVSIIAMLACYAVGNVTVKGWKKRLTDKKVMQELYD